MIQLGHTYKCRITGFSGVATGHVNYISGCNQTLLAPPIANDGAPRDSAWFDDQRLEHIDYATVIVLDNGTTPGCDKAAPRR